jgi:formylglycine-generating enzyme required for sulfatase activity
MHSHDRFPWITAAAFGLGSLAFPAAAQVTPYGSGINPAGSLIFLSGIPHIGSSFQLAVRNTAVAIPPPGVAFLFFSTQPAPGFPGGQPLPGLGLAFPGAIGELLIDVAAPNPFLTVGPMDFLGGPSFGTIFGLSVPAKFGLIGLDLYVQGLLVTPSQGFSAGLTNALQITLGTPSVPIPGVTPLPDLATIQPGTFLMGSNAATGAPYFAGNAEKPVHSVTISYPFWMGATEVTQAQYQALMGASPSVFSGPDHPVEGVTWFNAQDYGAALTAQEAARGKLPAGYQYRLPTEAEWEYVCRAGTTTEFNVGAALVCDQARFNNSTHSGLSCNSNTTLPVGSYPANPWGVFDMHGNVLEWCLDSFSIYPAGAVTDPFVAGGFGRILRGGSYGHFSQFCRSAYRRWIGPDFKSVNIGFRVVLAPVLVP